MRNRGIRGSVNSQRSRIMNLLGIMLMLCVASVSVFAQSEVEATVLRYDPTPAEQGNPFEVWIQLSNAGTTANNVAVQFIPEYPFSLPGEETGYHDVGVLTATEDKVVKFTIYPDVNAPNGDSEITFRYKYDSENWIELNELVTLQTQNAALIVEDYSVTPEMVVPGQKATVEMMLHNIGRIGVKNVDVSLDLSDEQKFSTLGTGSVQRIPHIGPGQKQRVSFTLGSDTSTEVKLYALPVLLAYQDDRNKVYETSAKISLLMNANPEIQMIVDETSFKRKQSPGTVRLQVINSGIANIKYATVRLVSTPDYEVLAPSNVAYVGNLDSDDFETVEFMIRPKADKPSVHVELDYKDEYNKDFKQQFTLPLRILTPRELGQESSPIGLILFAIVIAGGIVYYLRRRKRKKA